MAADSTFPTVLWSRAEGEDGPRMVFTHGWGDTGDTWQPQIDALRHEARVLAWDLRGHGRSDAPDDPAAYSFDIALADLDGLVGGERVVLVGHSFGGQLSMAYALRHPGRVAGLVLIATGPGYREETGRAEWNRGVEQRAQSLEAKGQRPLAHAIRGFVTQHDSQIMDALPSITAPALVIVGEKDRAFVASAAYLGRKLPNAEEPVVVPDAGHAVHQHQPAVVNEAISRLARTVR